MNDLYTHDVPVRKVQTSCNQLVQMEYLERDKVKKQPCVKMTYYKKEHIEGTPAWKQFHQVFVFCEESTELIAMLLSSGMTDMEKVSNAMMTQ